MLYISLIGKIFKNFHYEIYIMSMVSTVNEKLATLWNGFKKIV